MTEIDDLEDIAVTPMKVYQPKAKSYKPSTLPEGTKWARGKASSNAGRVDPRRADARLRKF
jgi:hypothetical protein